MGVVFGRQSGRGVQTSLLVLLSGCIENRETIGELIGEKRFRGQEARRAGGQEGRREAKKGKEAQQAGGWVLGFLANVLFPRQ